MVAFHVFALRDIDSRTRFMILVRARIILLYAFDLITMNVCCKYYVCACILISCCVLCTYYNSIYLVTLGYALCYGSHPPCLNSYPCNTIHNLLTFLQTIFTSNYLCNSLRRKLKPRSTSSKFSQFKLKHLITLKHYFKG